MCLPCNIYHSNEQWAYYAECKAAAGQGSDIRLCPVHSAKSKAVPLPTTAATANTTTATTAAAGRSSSNTAAAVQIADTSSTSSTTATVDTADTTHSSGSGSSSSKQLYQSQARVLLIGASADEQVQAVTPSTVTLWSCYTFNCYNFTVICCIVTICSHMFQRH
jgi:hypothetical protein